MGCLTEDLKSRREMKRWLKRYGRDLLYLVMLLVLSAVMYDQQKQTNQWIGEIQRLKKETADLRRHLKNVEADVVDADYRLDETESRIEEHQSDIDDARDDIENAQDDIDMNRIETEQNGDDINELEMKIDGY